MIADRIFDRIAEIFLSIHQDFEHHTKNDDQHRFQDIQSLVRIFEKDEIQTCAKTCRLKKKFVDRI
jgi:hypothetical protein